ncbi:MAG: hypothetical protein FP826_15280 [Sphingomonadales bacterium]|nr:hypothetical protein [Sphingomonadales bacterium]
MTLRFVQLAARDPEPLRREPYDRWLTLDGDPTLLFFRDKGGYLLRFLDVADFAIDLAGRIVACTPAPGITDEMVADLYFNQVIPLIMGHDGELVIHASAAAAEGAAIALVGSTGRGKSTLAGAFAQAGYPFLTDDGLILDLVGEGYVVRPRRPILRLRADSETALLALPEAARSAAGEFAKCRIAASAEIPFQIDPVPLSAIYILREPAGREDVAIAPLSPAAALSELIGHSFMLDVEDRPRVRAHFNRLAELAVRADCHTLDYPRRYEALPSVIDAIISHARSRGTDL